MHKQEADKLSKQTPAAVVARPSTTPITLEKLKHFGIKDESHFLKKFDELCKNWWDRAHAKPDTMASRLVTSTLASHLTDPVVLSIIADDVEAFNQFHQKKSDIFCLEFCCLCGSENIIRSVFLANNDMKKCLALSKNAIGYALSSSNTELALLLATEAVQLGKTDPGNVMLYTPLRYYETAKTIKRMFTKTCSNGNGIDHQDKHKLQHK